MKKIILLLVILFSISHISNGQTEIVVLKDSFEIKKFAKELSEKRNVDISIFRFKGKFDSDESPIGHWVVYSDYAMSKKAYEGNYKKGKKDGKWTLYANDVSYQKVQSFEYYEQGKLKKWTHFSDPDVKEFEIETKSEIPEEIIISLQFISQVTSSVGLASTRAGGSYYQVRKDFFNNVGSLLIRSDVEDAKMSFWGFEEQLEQEHYFLNGELDLKILYKNSFGKVERKESIRNDIRCELVQRDMRNFAMLTKITYYPNGKPNEIKHFNEETSLKEGIWVSHYFNGEKKIEGFYRHDLKHGLWKYRDDTGKLIKKEKYKNGVLIVK